MSPTVEALCCVPVLLLWLGPVAVILFCGVYDGCGRLARRYARAPHSQLPPPRPT